MIDWLQAPNDQMVCYCKGIDKATIVAAINKGNLSLSRIKESTSACTGTTCATSNPSGKCCSIDIYELIRLYGDDDVRAANISCNCGCGS